MGSKPTVSSPGQEQADLVELAGNPAFRRFLFRIAQLSDIYVSASGTDERHLRHAEGRRSLGLDIFRAVDEALSTSHPSGLPIVVMEMVLREASQQTPAQGSDHDDQDDIDEHERR